MPSMEKPHAASDHEAARTWAKRLGRVGSWTSDVERLTAAAARDYVRELERLGMLALWIPESLGSKEIFAHAGLLLGSSERLVIAAGIANVSCLGCVACVGCINCSACVGCVGCSGSRSTSGTGRSGPTC